MPSPADVDALEQLSTAHFSRPRKERVARLVPHGQPKWKSRSLRLGLGLVVLGWLALPAFAQDGSAPADPAATADGSSASSSLEAYLLPFTNIEPVTIIILLCSILAVTLIVQAFLRVRKSVLVPEESNAQIEQLIQQRNFRQLLEFTEQDSSFVSRSLSPALKRAPDFARMNDALDTSIGERTSEEFRKLEYINILANAGPLLGLLGTVIGIMAAFIQMRNAGGSAEVGDLAGGISVALGTTMLGLVLAIPCLVAYGILRNKADQLTQEGAMHAEDFLQMLHPDAAKGNAARAQQQAVPAQPRQPARQAQPPQMPQ